MREEEGCSCEEAREKGTKGMPGKRNLLKNGDDQSAKYPKTPLRKGGRHCREKKRLIIGLEEGL